MRISQSIKDILLQDIIRDKADLFLWIPVMIGIGIFCRLFEWIHISVYAYTSLMVMAVLLIVKLRHKYAMSGHAIWGRAWIASIALLLVVFGYGLMDYRIQSIKIQPITKDMYPQIVSGTIEKIISISDGKSKRVVLRDVSFEDNEELSNYGDYRLRLKSYHFKGDDWFIGDQVSVKAKLMAPSQAVIPSGFDYSRKAFFEGISAVGFTMAPAELTYREPSNVWTRGRDAVQSVRQNIARHIVTQMDDRGLAGLASALITGQREGIDDDIVDDMRAAGLAHVLAISGLHVGMIAGFVFFAVRGGFALIPSFALRYPIKKWAAICAIFIAFCYMIMAGATVPTVRAFLMTAIVLFAVVLDRSAINLRLLAVAAMVIMVMTPEAIAGPSFVLSFSAVSILIVFYQDIGRKWFVNARAYQPVWRPIYYVAGILVTSLIATLATAPFSILFFNRMAVYSLLGNILAMPILGMVIMPFGLIALCLTPVGLDHMMWGVMAWGLEHMTRIAHAVAMMDGAVAYFPHMDGVAVAIVSVGFILMVLTRRYLRVVGILLTMMGVLLSLLMMPRAQLMISDDAKAILFVNTSKDTAFLWGKMNSYLSENWLGYAGMSPDISIGRYINGARINDMVDTHCDDMRCRIDIGAKKGAEQSIEILTNPLSMAHACDDTVILSVAHFPIKSFYCPKVQKIDRFDVYHHGATLVEWGRDGVLSIQTVR